jgi:alpha-ribazole phosphatase
VNRQRRLWLVRHARPLVESGICYGASDLEADLQDTQRAALELADVLPHAARLFMSGLRRAQQLAHAIHALRPDLAAPVCDPRLNEMDFGRFELARWDGIAQAEFDAWTADFHSYRFGGRESVGEMLDRVRPALIEAIQGGGMDDVWVTHAGVIRAACLLNACPAARPSASEWPREAPAFGGWTQIEFNAHG